METIMYCVKCGVELADSERVCPLCETPVYFPDLEPNPDTTYPKEVKGRDFNPRIAICFIITCFYLIIAAIPLLCDLNINDGMTWSGLALGGALVFYVIFILPTWFKRATPAIFVPSSFLAIGLYLFYVNYYVGGDWFFSFALPVTLAVAVILSSVSILSYYLKRGKLYVAGGAFISVGAFCIFLEYSLHRAFHIHDKMVWSLYPATVFALIGIMLIVIAIVRPIREYLTKIFSV
jgi:hypothetical protein